MSPASYPSINFRDFVAAEFLMPTSLGYIGIRRMRPRSRASTISRRRWRRGLVLSWGARGAGTRRRRISRYAVAHHPLLSIVKPTSPQLPGHNRQYDEPRGITLFLTSPPAQPYANTLQLTGPLRLRRAHGQHHAHGHRAAARGHDDGEPRPGRRRDVARRRVQPGHRRGDIEAHRAGVR